MKSLISILLFLCLMNTSTVQKTDRDKSFFLIIGTYSSNGKNDGIYVYDFNTLTGDNSLKSKVAGEENPSFLAISHDGRFLYSANEVKNGNISSFKFDKVTGELSFLNRVSSGGDSPCFVEVDGTNKYLFTGNYGSGTLSAIPINSDGTLRTDIQSIKHEGSSIDKSRQQSPHVHSTFLAPDNKYLFVPDLGTDKVNIYSFDLKKPTQPLTPSDPSFIAVKPGSGPRHLAFHPNAKSVYLIHEMEGMVTAFDYKAGKLTEKQAITMLSQGVSGKAGAADIHVSPDGKFLYASNLGNANELVIYSIKKNGTLEFKDTQSTLGKTPRNFVIDPTGNFLLVANQGSNEIVIFSRDKKTGLLTATGKKIQVSKPVCLKFVSKN